MYFRDNLRGCTDFHVCMYSAPHTFKSIVIRNVPVSFLPTGNAEVVDWFKAADITKVKDACCLQEAEELLEKAEALVTEQVPNQFDRLKFLARAEGRVARLLAEKKHKAFPHYPGLPSIFQELEIEVSKYLANGTTNVRKDEEKKSNEVVCFVKGIMYLCMYVCMYVCIRIADWVDLNMLGTPFCVI